MSCKYQEKLALLVFAEIEGEEKATLVAHLKTCKTCQKNYQELQTTANLLKDGFATQANLALNDSHRQALFQEVNSNNSKTTLSISKKIFYAIAAIVAISVAATLHQYIDKNNKITIAKTNKETVKSKSTIKKNIDIVDKNNKKMLFTTGLKDQHKELCNTALAKKNKNSLSNSKPTSIPPIAPPKLNHSIIAAKTAIKDNNLHEIANNQAKLKLLAKTKINASLETNSDKNNAYNNIAEKYVAMDNNDIGVGRALDIVTNQRGSNVAPSKTEKPISSATTANTQTLFLAKSNTYKNSRNGSLPNSYNYKTQNKAFGRNSSNLFTVDAVASTAPFDQGFYLLQIKLNNQLNKNRELELTFNNKTIDETKLLYPILKNTQNKKCWTFTTQTIPKQTPQILSLIKIKQNQQDNIATINIRNLGKSIFKQTINKTNIKQLTIENSPEFYLQAIWLEYKKYSKENPIPKILKKKMLTMLSTIIKQIPQNTKATQLLQKIKQEK